MKNTYIVLVLILLCSLNTYCATGVIDSSYTYDYSQPPEFQPSFKSQFTALANSVTDVYANPAGIMRVDTLEVALGASAYVTNPIKSDVNTVYADDSNMGGIEDSPNSRAYVRFTDDRTVISPEARPITINEDYSKGGGINYFGMTYRIADWLAFSISRKRPTVMEFDYRMLTPVMADAQASFRGTSVEANGTGVYIGSGGTVEVRFLGIPVATSEGPAYAGFLDQGTSEVNWVNGTFNNSVVNQNSVVITAAGKAGPG